MFFKPKDFRSISEGSVPPAKIRVMDGCPIILVKASGEVAYATGRTDKDKLIERFDPTQDLLLWGWQGQYRTDMFVLTEEDIKNHYK